MKVSALKYAVLSWVSWLAMLILLLVPFHAFLTVWAASHFGHYTGFRLWKELLLALCAVGAICLSLVDHKIRLQTYTRRLGWLIIAYIVLTLVWGLVAFIGHDVTLKALGYGLLSDLRFLVFFLVTWAVALRMSRLRTHWQWLVYVPAIGVVTFGLLQIFVLPYDVLRHFGYGPATIPVYETINSNDSYHRIASTLRGANPLGAYLVVPITALVVRLVRGRLDWRLAGLLAATIVVLLYSFSRSAWIGVALSIGVVLGVRYGRGAGRRYLLAAAAGLALLAVLATALLGQSSHFKNLVFHTDDTARVAVSSNDGRERALRSGLADVTSEPLGRGPGTAGPASAYNTGHQVRISENYFLQVGQETGWLGLVLFIAINAGVGYLLWLRRADPLALGLFASLIGLTFINVLSHAWADDTLAYVWWGLAGIALARVPKLGDE